MDQKYKIKVLEKALRVLELFGEEDTELTATEIQGLLNLNKTSTFRIIKNLEEFGYLERDPANLKYRLGIKIYYLGSLVKPYVNLRKAAKPLLEEMNRQCEETVHLAVLSKGESLYLEKFEGKKTIRVMTRRGVKLPAHCSGVGKVLLAGLGSEDVSEIVKQRGLKKFTGNTITSLDELSRELERVRSRGYAVDNEEIEDGLMCAAAPVLMGERSVAAISVSMPKDRFGENESVFIALVKQTAGDISELLRQMDPARRRQA
jgi:IclR family transcriptional regulator, KDG regulon repressor